MMREFPSFEKTDEWLKRHDKFEQDLKEMVLSASEKGEGIDNAMRVMLLSSSLKRALEDLGKL